MITNWVTSFTVYPENCNYMKVDGTPMVHGGAMLQKMDRAAAELCRLAIKDSQANETRTVSVNNVDFLLPAKLGDILQIECYIVKFGIKRIDVKVSVKRMSDESYMANGLFIFCSFKDGESFPHGMKL